jgi:hypothetical protein
MKQFKYITIALMFLGALSINAQQKLVKTTESIKADKDVTLDLNTSHTNIEIDHWNKNEVKVEAYIESKTLSNEELQDILDGWDVKIAGSDDKITIEAEGDSPWSWNYEFNFDGEALEALEELQSVMADLPEMPEMPPFPEMEIMPEMPAMPAMPEMPEMPEMPQLPELPEGVNNVNFDFDAYKKDGEKYLEKWSKEYEEKFGKEYKDKMKAWAKKFAKTDFEKYSKEMEAWGEKFGESFGEDYEEKMEAWGKKFGEKFDGEWSEKMEKWAEEYEKKFGPEFEARMEARAKELEARLERSQARIEARAKMVEERRQDMEERRKKREIEREKRQQHLHKRLEAHKSGKVIKTIKIKMPKNAKLKVNVRHGELKFASVIHNLKADLSHATLIATGIDGSLTSINASYSPVLVTNWNLGELKLNYVENAQLKQVQRLMLHSNSSNIQIEELLGNAVINGSFGDLEINKIANAFNNLNLVLENSDALVSLPETDFNLQYEGIRTRFQHPEKSSGKNITTFSAGDLRSDKTIVINAKYSNVVMQ